MKLKPLVFISILIFTFCVPVSAWSDCPDKTIRCYTETSNMYMENAELKGTIMVTFLGKSKVGQCYKRVFLFVHKCMDCSDDREQNKKEIRICTDTYPGHDKDDYRVFDSNSDAKNHQIGSPLDRKSVV